MLGASQPGARLKYRKSFNVVLDLAGTNCHRNVAPLMITHALSWLETDLLEKSSYLERLSLNLQESELGPQQQADVAKSGSNQLKVLP